MSAYILVFSHPFFAVSDNDGRYEIPARAAGQLLADGLERARHGRRRAG